jgi:hypothetical protein
MAEGGMTVAAVAAPRAQPVGAGRSGRRALGRHSEHSSAFRFYLRSLFVPHSRREFLWAAIARLGLPAGRAALRLLGTGTAERLSAGVQAVDERISQIPRLSPVLRRAGVMPANIASLISLENHGRGPPRKRVLFLFERGAAEPTVVAKMSGETGGEGLRREHDTLCQLRGRLDDEIRRTLPAPLAMLSDRKQTATAEGYLSGRSIYFEIRNSWLPPAGAEEHFRAAAEWLRRFQQGTRAGEVHLAGAALAKHVIAPLEACAGCCNPSSAVRQLFRETVGRARKLDPTVPVVARHGDFWPGNLIVSGDVAGVVDWEAYQEKSNPFHDLLLFATSYGLNVNWKPGIWADPIAAFRATFLTDTGLSRIVRRHLHKHAEAIGLPDELLDVFFPVFLAEQALDEARKSRSPSEGRDGGRAPEESARHLWRRLLEEYARSKPRHSFAAGRVS